MEAAPFGAGSTVDQVERLPGDAVKARLGVERLGRHVHPVGPHDRAGLGSDAHLGEECWVGERFEHPAPFALVKRDVADGAPSSKLRRRWWSTITSTAMTSTRGRSVKPLRSTGSG